MNLLIVSGYWPTVSNPISGIFVAQQIRALMRHGVFITLIVPRTIIRDSDQLCSLQMLSLDESKIKVIEVPILRLPEKLSSLPGSIWLNTLLCGYALRKYLRQLSVSLNFDGCIVHGVRYVGLSLPIWGSYVRGRAAIVIHGIDPFLVRTENQRRVRRFCNKVASVSGAIVLVGRPLLSYAISQGFSSNKIEVVRNGTDLPQLENISEKQHSSTEVRRIVSVSNLVRLKGVDDNLRALSTIAVDRPDLSWEYRIVGDGPYRSQLEKLAVELGIERRVTFTGRIEYQKTMSEIEQCDVFSLPSWGEAFGIVYLEAMARMRPVIGCLENGAADIISDGEEGLLVPPRNISALAAALLQLLEDPARCSRMGQAGRATAETMSWDENARRMLNIISGTETRKEVL